MDPKLCLRCARRKLANLPEKPCADCLLLNVDPTARTRALAARPGPEMITAMLRPTGCSLEGGVTHKPARATGHFG